MTGQWPKCQIDHINNIKSDNRWINLREANNQLNHYNLIKPKNNTSGAKGVRKLKNGKFAARIKFNKMEIYLGIYDSLELASKAYFEKSKELANEFANIG
jgi:HNH endonuclease